MNSICWHSGSMLIPYIGHQINDCILIIYPCESLFCSRSVILIILDCGFECFHYLYVLLYQICRISVEMILYIHLTHNFGNAPNGLSPSWTNLLINYLTNWHLYSLKIPNGLFSWHILSKINVGQWLFSLLVYLLLKALFENSIVCSMNNSYTFFYNWSIQVINMWL